jgi:hypothetical protein
VVVAAGVVNNLALEEPVEPVGVDAVGSFDALPLSRGVGGLILTWSMPVSSSCRWKDVPNFEPLSVWTRSTAKGSVGRVWSMKVMAVFWSQRGLARSTCRRGAVVDGGELVVLRLRPGWPSGWMNLTSTCSCWPGPLLRVAFPAQGSMLIALGGGQPVQPQPFEDSPYPRDADRHVVVAASVHDDLGRAEMVVPPKPDDLLHHVGLGGPR